MRLMPIAFVKMAERRRQIAEVEKGFAERKVEEHSGAEGRLRFRRQQRLHRGDGWVGAREFHEIGAPEPCAARQGIELQRLLKRPQRRVLLDRTSRASWRAPASAALGLDRVAATALSYAEIASSYRASASSSVAAALSRSARSFASRGVRASARSNPCARHRSGRGEPATRPAHTSRANHPAAARPTRRAISGPRRGASAPTPWQRD